MNKPISARKCIHKSPLACHLASKVWIKWEVGIFLFLFVSAIERRHTTCVVLNFNNEQNIQRTKEFQWRQTNVLQHFWSSGIMSNGFVSLQRYQHNQFHRKSSYWLIWKKMKSILYGIVDSLYPFVSLNTPWINDKEWTHWHMCRALRDSNITCDKNAQNPQAQETIAHFRTVIFSF